MLSYNECKELFVDMLGGSETAGSERYLNLVQCTVLKSSTSISNFGMKLINEAGLYTLIARSGKPEAKPFQRWVTSEVLPYFTKRTVDQLFECIEHNNDYLESFK